LKVNPSKGQARLTLQLSVVAIASYAIFFPEHRTRLLHLLIGALFVAEAGVSFYQDWKSGLLHLTPRQIFQRFRESGAPRKDPLGTLALALGFIAIVVITW
jgi:hypothetical protein